MDDNQEKITAFEVEQEAVQAPTDTQNDAAEQSPKKGKRKNKPKKPPCAAYRAVDKYFGFTARGTNIKTEIYAGILMCIEVACFMMVMSFMLQEAGGFGQWNFIYYAIALISMISTILMGVICNAPFVQSMSLGMVVLIVSLLGNNAGLTYANVMAISLVSNFVYMAVMLIKPARTFIFNAVPESIRKVIPAALGAFLIVYALIQSNVFTINTNNYSDNLTAAGDAVSFFGFSFITFNLDTSDIANFYTYMPIVMAIIAFIVMMVLKNYKIKHATIISLGVSLLVYIVFWAVRGNFTDYNLYSFFVPSYAGYMHYNTGGLDRMFNSQLLGQAFKTGFDFSALAANIGTGGVVGVFLSAMASFLVIGVSETGAAVSAYGYITGGLDENGKALYTSHTFMSGNRIVGTIESCANVYTVNAISSVIGCAIGAGPVAVRADSAVGGSEGGKTGLSAIVAGLLLIVAVYNTFFSGIFMNGTIVCGIMIYVGLMLLTSLKHVDFSDINAALPALLMVVVAFVSANITAGVAVGITSHTVLKMLRLKFKEISIGTYVLTAVMVITLVCMGLVM